MPRQDNAAHRNLTPGCPGKIGRVQRQCRRLAGLRSEVVTRDLVEFAYSRIPPERRRHWHFRAARRAAEKYWIRVGRLLVGGRWQVLWRPKR